MSKMEELRKVLYNNKKYEVVIRNRYKNSDKKEIESLVYIDGQKAFTMYSDSIIIKKDVFNIPANKIIDDVTLNDDKEKRYTFSQYLDSKRELLNSSNLYSVKYPKKIVFKFVNDWNKKLVKVNKERIIDFLQSNKLYFEEQEKLDNLIDIINNIDSYSLKTREEKEKLGLVYYENRNSNEYRFSLNLNDSEFKSLEEYLKFEFYIQFYTAKCNPLKKTKIGIEKIVVNLTENDEENREIIEELLLKLHISFTNYSILFGGQDEKLFQDLLMKRRIVSKLNKKLLDDKIKLVPIEEELDLPTKHRKNLSVSECEDNGRIDNIYINNIDNVKPKITLMEVKYNDNVIGSFSDKDKLLEDDSCKKIGIYSHLFDLYYTITHEEMKNKFYNRLEGVIDNKNIRNAYLDNDDKILGNINKEEFDYLIVCGYDSTFNKNKIIDILCKTKEFNGIKDMIVKLYDVGVKTKIILINALNLLDKDVNLREIDINTYQDVTNSILNDDVSEFKNKYLEK